MYLRHLWLALWLLHPPVAADQLLVEHQGRQLAAVHRSDYSLPGVTVVDNHKLNKLMDSLDRQVAVAPLNASLNEHGGIVSGRNGVKLDRNMFTEQLYRYMYRKGTVKIEVPMQLAYPKVDSELLSHIREKQIGQYTTYYNTNNKNRSINIKLAAEANNNHVIFPGETFSFNEIVGQRTVERGYVSAPIIVKGEMSEGVGGGICQISSTLFNAVDRAGLQIVKRYSHSRNVTYVPPGRDATVSWNGPDFTFHNHYNQPILIRAFAYGGTVHIGVFSSEEIRYKQRDIPGASKELPEEVTDINVDKDG
ncbi:VanW family protein [Paenibacillus alvei]|uniref:VanW family protein n=1 Tax=Paenibacillus alvei TaxID=44250 RepID=UPI00227E4B1F|nr:VanW family protein [Paenibacillus alvei]MCY7482944.1 VanW family protein [Paenibacillus alvei]